jgi:biopolymer transport protein ExbD
MSAWLVRLNGDPTPRTLSEANKVLEGIRDGEWEPTDEVRGPADTMWWPIEEHPTFIDAIAEMGPPPPEPPDETRLDMNPLIDVALVLLVFFILTATYTTLRRTIDVPPPQIDDTATKLPKKSDIEDRVFNVTVYMDGEKPVVSIEKRVIVFEEVEKELERVVKETGRKEMYFNAADDVTWGITVRIQGAANEAGVRQIHIPNRK